LKQLDTPIGVATLTDDSMKRAPRDVVPPTPPSREQILRCNEAVGSVMPVSEPGEMDADSEGIPIGVGHTSTTQEFIGALFFYRDQLDAAGLTDDDVPNLTVIDREGT
jgi:hypothetical protein